MSTWLLWSLISIVTGNPLLAAGVVLLLWILGDRATFRVLPDVGRWFSRSGRAARLRRELDMNPHDRRARFGAVYAIIGFLSVPLTFLSIRIFRTIHPVVIGDANAQAQGGFSMTPAMLQTMFFCIAVFSVVFVTMLWHRIRLGQFAEAVARYRGLKTLSDKDFQTLALLHGGQAASQGKQWQQAADWLAQCVEKFPDSPHLPEARYELGWALQNLGKHDQAAANYEKVVAATDREVAARAQFMIGEIQFEKKQHAEAVKSFFKVAYTYAFPKWQADATYEAARCLEVLGKPGEAAKLYEKVIAEYPESDWAKVARRTDPSTVEGRLFPELRRLIALRPQRQPAGDRRVARRGRVRPGAPRRGAALLLELGAHLGQDPRLVGAAHPAHQGSVSEPRADRVDHGGLGQRQGAPQLADAGRSVSGRWRGWTGAQLLVPAHGPQRHGVQHRQG